MAVIKINNFGGEAPSLSARALAPGQAAVAKNLYPRVDEFRPLQADTVVVAALPGGVSNPKSLFRLERTADGTLNADPATGWTTSDKVMSYAKGQINDDLTGRTYYSFDDGSAPPRVMDAGVNPARDGLPVSAAVDKPLGIPPPLAPKVRMVVGDEFTPEEYEGLMVIKTSEVARAVRVNASFQLVGSNLVGDGTPGYLNSVVSGTVAPAVVSGGSPVGGGEVVVGGGGSVKPPAAPIQITLTPGGTYFPPTSPLYLHLYTAGGTNTLLMRGAVYTLVDVPTGATHTYAINGDNIMEMLT